tara:strand:- start:272 stop:409 length:138 start_codon:yes stop_codon:yes gene_type:complete
MKKFTQWHKDRIECAANHFGLSNYQLLWIASIKGILFGYIAGIYL